MSTITREFTKEQLQQIIETDHVQCGEASALARIALASLEAEKERKHHSVIAEQLAHVLSGLDATDHQRAVISCAIDRLNNVAEILQRSPSALPAPPAPVSVPAAMEMDDDFDSAFEHGKAVGWNACRAAMLQGADRPQNEPQNIPENIPATQFKPVADLYGLTSPTGGETSFTFDAVEARDFIDGGWLCQEYVTLERYQETLFQGAEPVSLRDGIAAIRNLGPIDAEKIQAERDALNSPVITDGWVACSERMPEKGRILALFGKRTKENCDPYVDEGYLGSDGEFYFSSSKYPIRRPSIAASLLACSSPSRNISAVNGSFFERDLRNSSFSSAVAAALKAA